MYLHHTLNIFIYLGVMYCSSTILPNILEPLLMPVDRRVRHILLNSGVTIDFALVSEMQAGMTRTTSAWGL